MNETSPGLFFQRSARRRRRTDGLACEKVNEWGRARGGRGLQREEGRVLGAIPERKRWLSNQETTTMTSCVIFNAAIPTGAALMSAMFGAGATTRRLQAWGQRSPERVKDLLAQARINTHTHTHTHTELWRMDSAAQSDSDRLCVRVNGKDRFQTAAED